MRALLSILMAIASVAHAQCEIRGTASVDRLRVRVAGAGIRTFATDGLPLAVQAGSGGHSRDVRVLGPISFQARTDAAIPWTFAREGLVAEGLLWWTPASVIRDAREVQGEIELRVRLATGVALDRLRVPCRAVRLGAAAPIASAPPSYPSGPHLMPRREETWIWSGAGEGTRARIRSSTVLPEPFIELARSGGWVQVATSFAETGAVLRGWVREGDLRIPDDAAAETHAPRDRSQRLPAACSYTAQRGEYVGIARIAGGTLIRDRPDGVAWAEVPGEAELRIAWRHGDDWAQIVEVHGLRSMDERCPFLLTHAWVPRRAVHLQGE